MSLGKHDDNTITVFIRLTALGAYLILGSCGWARIRGWALIIFPTFSASEDIFREYQNNAKQSVKANIDKP